MKKIIVVAGAALALISAVPALAADLPAATYAKTPVYVPPPVYNWTGFYVGGHIGGAWTSQSSTELAPGTPAFPVGTAFSKNNLSGFLGGVQGGFNWQGASPFVAGIEGEYSWADVTGSATTTGLGGFTSNVSAKTKDYALATGRVGYAADNWLFFVKGGGAWGQSSSTGTGITGGRRNIRHHLHQLQSQRMGCRRRRRMGLRAQLVRQDRVQPHRLWLRQRHGSQQRHRNFERKHFGNGRGGEGGRKLPLQLGLPRRCEILIPFREIEI